MDDIQDIIFRIIRAIFSNVWLLFILVGVLSSIGGNKDKKNGGKRKPAETAPPMTFGGETPARTPSTYASTDRRQREADAEFDSGMEFGSGSLFADESGTEWGKTKFGFDESEWGSSFGEKKDSEPIIYTGKN